MIVCNNTVRNAPAAFVSVSKVNGFCLCLAPYVIRHGVRVYVHVGSNTWAGDKAVRVTITVPYGVRAGIEKWNEEKECAPIGTKVSRAQFARACAESGVAVSFE